MGMWSWLKGMFDSGAPEPSKSTALAKVEPPAPPVVRSPEDEDEQEDGRIVVLDLMYNVQGGDDIPDHVMKEFMQKSRRRAVRHFKGKEVKHRVTHRAPNIIELEFNRPGDPNVVPGGSVRIRWTNKADEAHA